MILSRIRQFFKNKLKEIQNSNQKTKRKWLVIMTALVMIIVIGLWLVYLNQIVRPSPQESLPDTSAGNWQIFKNGLKVAFESIRDGLSNLISKITGSRTITIER